MLHMEEDPTMMGFGSLGQDGVLRQWDADRNVVDAAALSPDLMKPFLERFPYDKENEESFRGVDGRNIPWDGWFHPSEDEIPVPQREERRERNEDALEKNRKIYRERRERITAGTFKTYPVRIMSNNSLDLV